MRKFARRVTVALEMLVLILEIIPVSIEIYRTGRDLKFIGSGTKFVDLIFYFSGMISEQKFAQRVTVAWGTLGLILEIIPVSTEIRLTECDLLFTRSGINTYQSYISLFEDDISMKLCTEVIMGHWEH